MKFRYPPADRTHSYLRKPQMPQHRGKKHLFIRAFGKNFNSVDHYLISISFVMQWSNSENSYL